MNVSLVWNSVGFNQIAKFSMIPVSCFLEVVLDKVRYSRDTKLSIVVVLLGVAVCTVTDVSVNTKGLIACLHNSLEHSHAEQYYVHYLQRTHALGSFNLLGHTAPALAASLLLLGPFLDYWLTSKRVDAYNYGFASVFFIVLSCSIAVGTNLSQFICMGRFTAVIPSAWPYEDHSGSNIRIHLFRERLSQLACDFGYGHCSCGNDLVW